MELTAASMNSMPRALEIVAEYLKSHARGSSKNGGGSFAIDGAFVRRLYDHLFDRMETKYRFMTEPSIQLLFAIFFRETVPLDEEILDAIQGSIATNPITKFGKKARLVPETSIVMLKAAIDLVNDSSSSDDDEDLLLFSEIGEGIDAILDKIICYENIGDILEVTLQQALHIRTLLFLAVARTSCSSTYRVGDKRPPHKNSIARLCGLQDIASLSSHSHMKVNGTILELMSRRLVWSHEAKYSTYTLKTCSHSSPSAFVDELKSIEVNATSPFILILPHESKNGEAWDVCMKCFVADRELPFYIFFDAKSGSENLGKRSTSTIEHVKSNPRQYNHTATIVNNGTGCPFLYVYVSTYDDDSCVLGGNGIIMGRNDSFNLLGPVAEFYRVARDTIAKEANF